MDGETLFDISSPAQRPSNQAVATEPHMVPAFPTHTACAVARVSDAEYAMLMDAGSAITVTAPIDAFTDCGSVEIVEVADETGFEATSDTADADQALDTSMNASDESATILSSAVMGSGMAGAELERGKIVELILSINTSVAAEYLDQFKDRSLRNYLAHLESAAQPRGRGSRWERLGDSPALVVHESAL